MALNVALTHRKTRRLAKALGLAQCLALGVLEALWIVAREKAPTGAIGAEMTDQDVADEMYWDGDAAELVEALVATGWLDRDPAHRLVIHHWSHHVDDSVHRKVARSRLLFSDGTVPKLARLPKSERLQAEAFYSGAHPNAPRAHDEQTPGDAAGSGAHFEGSDAHSVGSGAHGEASGAPEILPSARVAAPDAHSEGSGAEQIGSGAHVVRTTSATSALGGALPEPEPVGTDSSSELSGGEPPADPSPGIVRTFLQAPLTAEMPPDPPGPDAEPFARIAWTLRKAHGALPDWSPPIRADVTRQLPADSAVRSLIDLFGEAEAAAMFVFAHGDWTGGKRPTWPSVVNQRDQLREKMRGYEPAAAPPPEDAPGPRFVRDGQGRLVIEESGQDSRLGRAA